MAAANAPKGKQAKIPRARKAAKAAKPNETVEATKQVDAGKAIGNAKAFKAINTASSNGNDAAAAAGPTVDVRAAQK
jgi:hypothetical protein